MKKYNMGIIWGSYGPMVKTTDFESVNLGSIPSKT